MANDPPRFLRDEERPIAGRPGRNRPGVRFGRSNDRRELPARELMDAAVERGGPNRAAPAKNGPDRFFRQPLFGAEGGEGGPLEPIHAGTRSGPHPFARISEEAEDLPGTQALADPETTQRPAIPGHHAAGRGSGPDESFPGGDHRQDWMGRLLVAGRDQRRKGRVTGGIDSNRAKAIAGPDPEAAPSVIRDGQHGLAKPRCLVRKEGGRIGADHAELARPAEPDSAGGIHS